MTAPFAIVSRSGLGRDRQGVVLANRSLTVAALSGAGLTGPRHDREGRSGKRPESGGCLTRGGRHASGGAGAIHLFTSTIADPAAYNSSGEPHPRFHVLAGRGLEWSVRYSRCWRLPCSPPRPRLTSRRSTAPSRRSRPTKARRLTSCSPS